VLVVLDLAVCLCRMNSAVALISIVPLYIRSGKV